MNIPQQSREICGEGKWVQSINNQHVLKHEIVNFKFLRLHIIRGFFFQSANIRHLSVFS